MADIYKSPAGQEAIAALYRRVLARWPVPHEELVVATRHGDTFVVASGDMHAPPIVLFHGSGTNSGAWIRDVAEWSRSHRVYAVDLIGEPGFSATSRLPLASDLHAAWLDDVWDRLGLETASIVGISLGGWLGLDYAVRRPRRVASLSLLSPSGIGRQHQLALLKVSLWRLCGGWGLRKSMQLVAGRTAPLPPQLQDALLTVFRNFKPRMERIPMRSDAELAALPMPVQVVLGAHDALIDAADTRARLQRCVPQLQLTYLDHEGHILPSQARNVADFLAGVGTSERPVSVIARALSEV